MNEEDQVHSRLRGAIYSFLGLLIAIMLGVLIKGNEIDGASTILIMLAVSIPSLVAVVFLDFHLRVQQKVKVSLIRGLAFGLGFIPGLLAIAFVIANVSVAAAVIFVVLTVIWLGIVSLVAIAPALREVCCESEHNNSIEKDAQ